MKKPKIYTLIIKKWFEFIHVYVGYVIFFFGICGGGDQSQKMVILGLWFLSKKYRKKKEIFKG